MLPQFERLLNEGANAIPAFSPNQIEYLQTLFSSGYQFRLGNTSKLMKEGWSEQYILGYLAGLETASQLIDQSVDAITPDE